LVGKCHDICEKSGKKWGRHQSRKTKKEDLMGLGWGQERTVQLLSARERKQWVRQPGGVGEEGKSTQNGNGTAIKNTRRRTREKGHVDPHKKNKQPAKGWWKRSQRNLD